MYSYCNKLWSRHLKVFRVSTIPSSASTIELLPTADSDKLQHDLDLMLSSLANVDTNDHLEDLNTTILQATKEEEEPGNEGYSLHEALYKLIEKIQQATQRSLDGQRVDPSSRLQHQLDIASLGALVDRMNKRRLVDQVCTIQTLFVCWTCIVMKHLCFLRIGYLTLNNWQSISQSW